MILESTFYRPCWAEIDLAALRSNWRALKRRLAPKTQMLAVVKANAYGHGLVDCARVAAQEHAALLGVSSIEEGIALRKAGLRLPVLILGALFPFSNFPVLMKHRLTPTIASLQAAHALSDLARSQGRRHAVHLKIDSGFGRIGVRAGEKSAAVQFVKQASRLPGIIIEGLYTHFSSSDVDRAYTLYQHAVFQDVVHAVSQAGIRPRWIHEANSSALLKFPETQGTLVRPGLSYYGIAPYSGASRKIKLIPALAWKTRVIFLKTVPKGFAVSYARTWIARRATRIATVAAGYADGLPRLLSNKGHALVRGVRRPIIGRVTMDMTMLDVTEGPDCQIGDEVVLLGPQGKEEIDALEMAEQAQTNAYEIVSRIAPRVPRIVIHG